MTELENASVDLIKENEPIGTEEDVQSNTEIEKHISVFANIVPKSLLSSTSVTLGSEDIICQKELSQSTVLIDTKSSTKYFITLGQARTRALKSIKRAKEKYYSLLDEDY